VDFANWDPCWSPDGSSLVFCCGRNYRWEIWRAPVDGGPQTRLITDVASIHNLHPSCSPDGARIAFSANRINDNNDIWTMAEDGGDLIRLTDDPAWDESPTWSPDGEMIAFASDRSGNMEIWILWVD
jgi:TolB protein